MELKRIKRVQGKAGWLSLLVLALLLAALFHRSASSRLTLFANDGPLGVLESQGALSQRASNFVSVWQSLNWVGNTTLPLMPDLSHAFFLAGGPLVYSKFHAPLALLFLGLATALLFIRMGAPPAVVVLVAVAAALNGDAISHACWGLPPVPIGMGFAVLALAAVTGRGPVGLPRLALAGFAVGLAVMESYDVGAILSLYVAAFVLFQALTGEGAPGRRAAKGVGGVALVAAAAVFISAQALSTLVGTQVKGVAGMAQDEATRAHRWREATQWSLPKWETLQIMVPGLFGYRMDTPEGGNYWGGVGRDPVWDEYLAAARPDPAAAPQGALLRHSGAGFYAGVFVLLVATWGLVNSCRRAGNPYLPDERRQIWFWCGAAVISLLLAYGRHAPFYQWIYQLPFFSTIRNPIKFLHPMSISLVILFGYGLQGLWRGYVEPGRGLGSGGLGEQLRLWWRSARVAERRWVLGSVGLVVLAGLGWLVYSASTERMAGYLGRMGFSERQVALEMARFSAGEAGIGLVFLAAAVGVVVLLMSGAMSGKRQRWAGVLVGVVLAMDLARASQPWIVYYDYREKYAGNVLIDFLSQEPMEHRVTGRVMPKMGMNLVNQEGEILASVYHEWLEHLFQYYRVQSLDIIQMPRTPLLDEAYLEAFRPGNDSEFGKVGRLWQLTNTRYVLGMTGFLDFLNQQFDPVQRRFRVHTAFTLGPKPGVQQLERLSQLAVTPATNGPFALFEFEAALPRVGLHTRWTEVADDEACLRRLQAPDFDSLEEVLVSGAMPAPVGPATSDSAGVVEIVSYQPKRIELRSRTAAPSVLLLNDRYHEDWKVYVNGERRDLLRCNYLMRGVFLEPGEAGVEFRFDPPVTALYISLAALATGAVLLGMMRFGSGSRSQTPGTESTRPNASSNRARSA